MQKHSNEVKPSEVKPRRTDPGMDQALHWPLIPDTDH